MKGKAGGKRSGKGSGRKRTGKAKSAVEQRRNKDARLVADAVRQLDLAPATKAVIMAIFRLWQTEKDTDPPMVDPAVPALAKKLGVCDRTVQRALTYWAGRGIVIEVTSEGVPVARSSGGQVVRPKGGSAPTRYFLHTRALHGVLWGEVARPSEELRDVLMFRAWAAPSDWETANRSAKWSRRPVTLPVTQTGDTQSDIPEQLQRVNHDAHTRSTEGEMTGDTDTGFYERNHTVAPNAHLPCSLYSPRAHTHLSSFTDSARRTGFREEASRGEPSAFTENPSLPLALPVQEEPDAATSVVPFAPREARPATASPEESPYPYGCAINGNPKTWTGRIVRVDEWHALSEWDRHGSTGKVWNGITRQWEADTAPQESFQGTCA